MKMFKMKSFPLFVGLVSFLCLFAACTEVNMSAPKGEKGAIGPKGLPGLDGKDAYQLWKEAVESGEIDNWVDSDTRKELGLNDLKSDLSEAKFIYFMKGVAGKNGIADEHILVPTLPLFIDLAKAGRLDNPHKKGEKWPADKVSQSDLYDFLRGVVGDDAPVPTIVEGEWTIKTIDADGNEKVVKLGKAIGKDGTTAQPVIPVLNRETKTWWIQQSVGSSTVTIDSGVKAIGDDAKKPVVSVDPATKVWVINGVKSDVKAVGQDSAAPVWEIKPSKDGVMTWYKDGIDTGVSAVGKKGKDGKNGANGKDGVAGLKGEKGEKGDKGRDGRDGARGPKGDKGDAGNAGLNGPNGANGNDGKDGDRIDGELTVGLLSAYEIWKADVLKGHADNSYKDKVMNPNDPTQLWPEDQISPLDFWYFRSGKSSN